MNVSSQAQSDVLEQVIVPDFLKPPLGMAVPSEIPACRGMARIQYWWV